MQDKLRPLALLCALVLLMGSLAACSSGNNSSNGPGLSASSGAENGNTAPSDTGEGAAGKEPEPVTLTIFAEWVINPLSSNIQTDPVMEEIRKQTGITLDFEPFLGSGDANARLSTLLASNDLPDIVIAGSEMMAKLAANRKIIPLDDLVASRGQNLSELFPQALSIMRLQSHDGKLYYIPSDINGGDYNPYLSSNLWSLRWDLYKRLGEPKMDSLDDFVNVMKQMQQLEPVNNEGKPNYGLGLFLGDSWGSGLVDKGVANAQGFVGAGGAGIFLRDAKQDVLVPRLHDPNSVYWEALRFYNKAYREGVLDPESATMKFSNVLDKAQAGRYLASYGNWLSNGLNESFVANGQPEKGYVTVPVWQKTADIYANAINDGGNQFKWGISANSKHSERAMDLINFLASYDAVQLLVNGPEGLTWEMKDGKPALKEQAIIDMQTDPDYRKKTGAGLWTHMRINGNYDHPGGWRTNLTWEPDYFADHLQGAQKAFMEEKGYSYPTEGVDRVPNNTQSFTLQASLSLEPGSDLAAKQNNIAAYADTAATALIFAKSDDEFAAGKAKVIEEVMKMGIEDVFEHYYNAYEALKQKVANLGAGS